MKDLIIAAVTGHSWKQMEPYVVSLMRTGFSGDKVIGVHEISQSVKDILASFGFVVIDLVDAGFSQQWASNKLFTKRWCLIRDYLETRVNDYRYVLMADVRDVIFQSNPSEWLDQNATSPCILAANMGGWPDKTRPAEDDEVRKLGPEIYSWLREQSHHCAGTVLADAQTMLLLASKMVERPSAEIWDEAWFNYLIRVSPFKEVMRVPMPEESWIATLDSVLHPCSDLCRAASIWKFPVMDEVTSLVRAPGTGVPFSIVHQYDRSSKWTEIMHNKYKLEGDVRG